MKLSGSKRKWIGRLLPWLLLCVALLMVFSQVQNPRSLINVGVPWARVGALAIVMTAIILTGGIDLSVASIVSLSSMVMGVLWRNGWSVPSAAIMALVTGIIAGGFNGTLVVVGLPPLVATLATMAFYSGLALMISGAERITGFPESGLVRIAGLPTEYWILAGTFVTALFVIHFTRFGRWCYALGDNPLAARFAAVPVHRTHWFLYAASGLVAGLLAVIYTMRDGAIPNVHRGIELNAIACVVVGGTLITGGRGGIPLTMLGLVIIANVDIGLSFMSSRVEFFKGEARLVVVGVLLIAIAVWNEWTARDDAKEVERI